MFGRAGTVTVIEEPVMRNYARMAKVAFWIVSIVSALLASIILSALMPLIDAAILAVFIGAALGFTARVLVTIWPVLRAIWWWLPEITLVFAAIAGWLELTWYTLLIVRVLVVLLVVGVPAGIGPVRRGFIALALCLVSRHRIRTCFSEFIITNRYGTLPLILWAWPTPAGERLWIWLRPGLSVKDIQDRADQVAAACWAATVVIDRANPGNSALVRIDIKRRDPLNRVIDSPLKATIAGFIPKARPGIAPVTTALDLTDVTAEDVTTVTARPKQATPPKWPNSGPLDVPQHKYTPSVPDQDEASDAAFDISDYL
jgi:hypothetical protein